MHLSDTLISFSFSRENVYLHMIIIEQPAGLVFCTCQSSSSLDNKKTENAEI